jgi:2-keto-4-pentenoate hydratase/2-oxohepta-3-ene-1,7-dioic acid hydratase in catechol pathway
MFGILGHDETEIEILQNNFFYSLEKTGNLIARSEVDLLHPCDPSKFIGLWNNFHELAKQQNNKIPNSPLYFIKGNNSYLSPNQDIKIPKNNVGRILYEGELGIVVGKMAKDITPLQAKDHIFGYTCVNDVTAIEILNQDDSFKQWTRAKSFDTFGPFGPYIVTDLDYKNLTIKTSINGRERQSYAAADMIFNPEQIVSFISHDMTLNPGDVIACGTSTGVLPIKSGQTVEVYIEGIGKLSNPVKD